MFGGWSVGAVLPWSPQLFKLIYTRLSLGKDEERTMAGTEWRGIDAPVPVFWERRRDESGIQARFTGAALCALSC